jgi:hypothetical protein
MSDPIRDFFEGYQAPYEPDDPIQAFFDARRTPEEIEAHKRLEDFLWSSSPAPQSSPTIFTRFLNRFRSSDHGQ